MMIDVNIFSDWKVHLLQSVKPLENFTKLVLSLNIIDRVIKALEVCNVLFYLSKVVGPLYCINRALKCFQVSNIFFKLLKVM